MSFNIDAIRADFPILSQKVNGKPLVYFDNVATSQKPQVVIDAISKYYQDINANIHRGVHTLSQLATDAYEASRGKIQNHINAKFPHEVLFTSGTTHGINLVANGFASLLKSGDEVLVSALEHHSNIVPWQMLSEKTGAVLRVIPMDEKGELIMAEFDKLLSNKTKIVTVNHISNALGTVNPIKYMIDKAHEFGAAILIDGAQAVPHLKPDVQELDCDFFAFSGHKVFGPTGVGILYGKKGILEALPPYQGGGEMIAQVSFAGTTFNELPYKFEAGTPNIADVIGLGAAIDYMNGVDRAAAADWELSLMRSTAEQLSTIPGIRLIGTAPHKAAVVSFVVDGVNALDLGMYLDTLGIAVRTGHHCTQPVMDRLGIPGTIRASFMFYNTQQEVDALVVGVRKGINLLRA
jgi:cysteine desulfurase/selenocysteine lyase